MRVINWDNVNTAGANPLPKAGGYRAVIRGVTDNEQKEFLLIKWDYLDGELEGLNKRTFERMHFWPAIFLQSYKTKALPFFKRFKSVLEQSNPRYAFDEEDLQAMVGLEIGVVLGEEAYKKNNGNVGKRVYVSSVVTLDDIANGRYSIPPFKPLAGSNSSEYDAMPSFSDLDDDDDGEGLPF